MKKIIEFFSLSTVLKISLGFILASVYYNTNSPKSIPEKTDITSRSEASNSSTTKLPDIVEKSISELEQVKFVAHDKFNERRKRIQDYCDKNSEDLELQEVNNDIKWNQDLWFDYKQKLIFCQISKVSSSTWVQSLMSLNGRNIIKWNKLLKNEGLDTHQWRPEIRKRLFPLQHSSFKDAKKDLLSFVFVREPFTRIVSSYHDKMNRDWSKPQFDMKVAIGYNMRD